MEFSKETPMGQVRIQGKMFDIPRPFAEGHVCTTPEAGVLNQTLAENARNNMAKAVAEAVEDETFDQVKMQARIDEYLEDYDFGARRGRGPIDPVEREAIVIAKDAVRQALRENGYKLADVAAIELNRLVDEAIEGHPEITKEAGRRVKQRQAVNIGSVSLSPAPDSGDEATA